MSQQPQNESDAQLMTRVQADDTGAFAQLYDRHAVQAFGLARAVCRDAGRAEDAVQEAFLGIWNTRERYRASTGSFKSWAMQFVRRRAIDVLRRERTRPPVAEVREHATDPDSPSVPGRVIARSEADALRASLRELPDAQAEVVTLAFFGQLSHSEIAQRLALPAGTVKGRMRLGLEKLREGMNAEAS